MPSFIEVMASGVVALLVTSLTLRVERQNGKAMLYSICGRFFVSAINCYDQKTGQFDSSDLIKAGYVSELKSIIDDINELSKNPYYSSLVYKNVFIQQLPVQLRRELTEHEFSNHFALNKGSLSLVISAYESVQPKRWELWKRSDSRMVELVHVLKTLVGQSG